MPKYKVIVRREDEVGAPVVQGEVDLDTPDLAPGSARVYVFGDTFLIKKKDCPLGWNYAFGHSTRAIFILARTIERKVTNGNQ